MEPRPTTVSSKARQTPRQWNVAPCFARDTFALAPEEGPRGQGCLWMDCAAQPEPQAHGPLQVNDHAAARGTATRSSPCCFPTGGAAIPCYRGRRTQARGIRTALLWIEGSSPEGPCHLVLPRGTRGAWATKENLGEHLERHRPALKQIPDGGKKKMEPRAVCNVQPSNLQQRCTGVGVGARRGVGCKRRPGRGKGAARCPVASLGGESQVLQADPVMLGWLPRQ